jgi:ferredoxin
MVRVRFEPSGREVEMAPGERLLDAVDELSEPPLDFPCRDASCGRCAVELVRGTALWIPAGDNERCTLGAERAAGGSRLGCQLIAGGAPGDVVLARSRGRLRP